MESNYSFNIVLERYGITNRHPYQTYLELTDLQLNTDFIYSVVKLFEGDASVTPDEFSRYEYEVILDYIRKTHRLYLVKKLPEIEQSIELLLQDYSEKHPLLLLLRNFFVSYTKDLSGHIMQEERWLLPYITFLHEAAKKELQPADFFNKTKKYSIKKFTESHSNTEEDLADIRNVILLYEPPRTNETPYRILVSQLELFEKDLNIHAFIEDHVLLPKAQEMENELMEKLERKVLMN